jgi:hypothetical protein
VFGGRWEEKFISDRGSETDNFDAVSFTKVFLCYRASRDSSYMVSVLYHFLYSRYTRNSPIVSRALLRPPPELALTPYFSK